MIGLDVGGTTVKGGLIAADGSIVRSASRPTPVDDIGDLIDTLAELSVRLAREEKIQAIGVGLPGLRSADTGEIVASPNVPCLNGANVETRLAPRVDAPVVTRNDADMGAWGEFSVGAGAGTRHMICLTLGTGVGSGLILDGQLYNGSRGYAAEAGHIVVDPDGLPCGCGSRGCLEAVASATGIVALARSWFGPDDRKRVPEPMTSEAIAKAAQEGHEASREVYDQAGRYLGIACASLINLLNPEAIVMAGGVIAAGDLILDPTIREARTRAFDVGFEACRIVPARLGSQAGIVGAGLFAAHLTR